MLSGIPCTSKGEEPQQQQELPTLLDNNKDKEGDDVKPPEAGAEAGADISTEDVVKAFQQIKGATVTVIKKKKKKDQDKDKDKEKDKDKDKKSKSVRLVITSKKSQQDERRGDEVVVENQGIKKPKKKVKLVVTAKGESTGRRKKKLGRPPKKKTPGDGQVPLSLAPSWSVIDALDQQLGGSKHRIKQLDQDLEDGVTPAEYDDYDDYDEFDPNEVLRMAEQDRARQKNLGAIKDDVDDLDLQEHLEATIKVDPDGAPPLLLPPEEVLPIKVEKVDYAEDDFPEEDTFQSYDFPNENDDEEEEILPPKRARKAPKRRRFSDSDEDFELKNELAELNGEDPPPAAKKRRRGPGRPPKVKKEEKVVDGNDVKKESSSVKKRRPKSEKLYECEDYEGKIEMTALSLDHYIVIKSTNPPR